MSHSPNNPILKYAQTNLPSDLEEGTFAYDETNAKMVAYKNGSWGDFGGASETFDTVLYDFVSPFAEKKISGDIPESWVENEVTWTGLRIGNSAKTIGRFAWAGCLGLTGSIIIPDSVETLGWHAFNGCSSLNGTLKLSEKLTLLDYFTFKSCPLTGALVIPDGVTEIREECFYANRFSSVTFNPSLTFIDRQAFYESDNLTAVDFTTSPLLKEIIGGAFFFSANLSSVTFNEGIEEIGNQSFSNCNISGEVILPSSLTRINNNVFSNNPNLTSIVSQSTAFGLFAPTGIINDCTGLQKFHFASPAQVTNDFIDADPNISIYVTAAYLSQYDATWRTNSNVPVGATVQEWTSYPNPMP